MRLTGVAALALPACLPSLDHAPPVISEPADGATLDRTLQRVRIDPPYLYDTPAANWASLDGGAESPGHASWRVDEGDAHEGADFAQYGSEDGDFAFPVVIPEGEHVLGVARCTAIDDCGWSSVTVRVDVGPGSPDPALGGTGQVALSEVDVPRALAVGDDGTVLVAGTTLVYALAPDGSRARSFGDDGRFAYDAALGDLALAATDAGFVGVWVTTTGGTFTRFDGTTTPFAPTDGATFARGAVALAPDADGGLWVACGLHTDAGDAPGLLHLDEAGAVTSTRWLGAPGDGPLLAADLDPSGRVAALTAHAALLGDPSGLDATFGIDGRVPSDPLNAPTVALDGDGVVLARGATVARFAHDGTSSSLDLPLAGVVRFARGDDAVYAIGTREQPAEATWLPAPEPGFDTALVRLGDGGIDPTFGDDGVAWSSARLVFRPIAVESAVDAPVLALVAHGAPYVVGVSASYPYATESPSIRREPLTTVTRWVP